MRRILRNLIVGPKSIPSRGEYKYAMLRGEYALILIIICAFYIFYNWWLNVYDYIPYYVTGGAVGIVILYLNRNSYYKFSSIIFLATINLMIYVFADVQRPFGSVFLFFNICALLGVVFLRDHRTTVQYFFIALPYLLGLIAYYFDFNLLGAYTVTKLNFVINFSVSMLLSLLFVRFLIDRNEDEIRERTSVEEELKKQNDLLTKTNKELDHFVYSVSHDLKAPLSSIKGLTNLYSLTKSTEEREEINAMIKERVKDLDAFIKEVLDYSRNERLALSIAEAKPYSLINKIVRSLDHMKGFDKVTIENRIDAGFEVKTDPDRLQVVFTNLLVNAITYRDSKKTNSTITVDAFDKVDHWDFVIADNGIGIKEEYLDKIFEMFYRADDRIGTGSGLGLYIVRETAARLQGSITVDSTFGEGSTFKLRFSKQI
ncbi:MAG: HAMP domain-containing sensor histidine kinase [Cyclobacteriaceae bacterium]